MTIQSYVCTDPEIIALRKKMAALAKKHNLPIFDFNVKAQIPARSILLKACESLDIILSEFIDGTDTTASNAFCAMVSSYANKIDHSLSYYHRMSPPLSVAYRPLQFRIAWYAEQSKKSALTK
ncbi:hypothetical protein PZE02_003433 [Salmonella enterica subsp. enterica serovar Vitkin]|uniref:Uncharacterized protein n=3 Tax=Salmonella enterica TaxID=28901 RepID=A0A5Z6P523_SALET|nr:hypothetical protein [Salmonella enterica]EBG5369752.1 hypothetical protein [Salmonella enterica subsp. enterica serovar Monschaui]EBH8281037.1 hypothetical protein [Salmonella enterica subsp. enterica serovar Typhimurium str. UK-1]EBP3975246.1 hypothetical protein [Salmonella enterica subsp. enterica]EBS2690413.1 hypothetical protein [Salmonella enterica subsp. enterica serovar Muenchen]EBY0128658.1 hypothetical protein [Salmonella enterica subsp. enterica serovar Vitkin]EBY1916840.1 hypo